MTKLKKKYVKRRATQAERQQKKGAGTKKEGRKGSKRFLSFLILGSARMPFADSKRPRSRKEREKRGVLFELS